MQKESKQAMKRTPKHKQTDYTGKPSGKSKYALKRNAQRGGTFADTSPFRHGKLTRGQS